MGKSIPEKYRETILPFSRQVERLIYEFHDQLWDMELDQLLNLLVAIKICHSLTKDHASGKTYFTSIILKKLVEDIIEERLKDDQTW